MSEQRSDQKEIVSQALRAALANRDELHHALIGLEQAVAAAGPARAPEWARDVAVQLAAVEATFGRHIHVTEADNGLYPEIMSVAPRLQYAVDRLRDDHRTIGAELAQLAASVQKGPTGDVTKWIDDQREQCVAVLGRLTRHRQRGADLTYEAYADVGGDG